MAQPAKKLSFSYLVAQKATTYVASAYALDAAPAKVSVVLKGLSLVFVLHGAPHAKVKLTPNTAKRLSHGTLGDTKSAAFLRKKVNPIVATLHALAVGGGSPFGKHKSFTMPGKEKHAAVGIDFAKAEVEVAAATAKPGVGPVALADAPDGQLYVPVHGTSPGSVYWTFATFQSGLRLAAKYDGSGLSLRAEGFGSGSNPTLLRLQSLGFTVKGHYASMHLTGMTDDLVERTLGAVIVAMPVSLSSPMMPKAPALAKACAA